MNKIIFISLVILFAICSRSWALPSCPGSPAETGTSYINNGLDNLHWFLTTRERKKDGYYDCKFQLNWFNKPLNNCDAYSTI